MLYMFEEHEVLLEVFILDNKKAIAISAAMFVSVVKRYVFPLNI